MLALVVFVGLVAVGTYISRTELRATEAPPSDSDIGALMHPDSAGERSATRAVGVETFERADIARGGGAPGVLERTAGAPTAGAPEHKRELPNFGDVAPSAPPAEIDRSRYEASISRDGTLPFQPARVNAGTANDIVRTAATPPNIDELRGGAHARRDTAIGKFTGPATVVAADGARRRSIARDTARARSVAPSERVASASSAVGRRPMDADFSRPCHRTTTEHRDPYATDGVAAHSARAHVIAASRSETSAHDVANPVGSFGTTRDRRRDIDAFDVQCLPGRRVPEGVLGAAHGVGMGVLGTPRNVVSDIAPDPTTKELAISNPRLYGNFQTSNPPRATAHDPNVLPRTTIKETTVHDTYEGWISPGTDAAGLRSPDALARTTARETLPEPEQTRGGPNGAAVMHKAPVYNPGDVFDTTGRETLVHDTHTGNVQTMANATRVDNGAPAVATQRSHFAREHFGSASVPGAEGAYSSAHYEPSRHERAVDGRLGGASSMGAHRPSHRSLQRIVDAAKEGVLRGRSPTPRRETLAIGARDRGPDRSSQRTAHPSRPRQRQNQALSQRHIDRADVGPGRDKMSVHRDAGPTPYAIGQLASNPYVIAPLL